MLSRFLLALAVAGGLALAVAPGVRADLGPVHCAAQNPASQAVCQAATGDPGGAAQTAAGGAVSGAGNDALVALTKALAAGAGMWVDQLEKLLWSNATTPDFTTAKSKPFWDVVGRVFAISAVLAAMVSLASLAWSVAMSSWRGLGKWLGALASVGPAFPAIVTGLAALLLLADAITPYISGGDGANIQHGFAGTVSSFDKLPPQVQGQQVGAWLFVCLLALVGAIGIAAELLVREALLYVLVGILPLTLLGGLFPRGFEMLKKVLLWMMALVLAKPVIAIILAVGFALTGGLDQGVGTQGLARGLAGVIVLLLAVAAPLGTVGLLGLAGHELGERHGGMAVGAATGAAGVASSGTRSVTQLAVASGGGESSSKYKLAEPKPDGSNSTKAGAAAGMPGADSEPKRPAAGGGSQAPAAAAGAAGGPAAAGVVKAASTATNGAKSIAGKGADGLSKVDAASGANGAASRNGSGKAEGSPPKSARDDIAGGSSGGEAGGGSGGEQPF